MAATPASRGVLEMIGRERPETRGERGPAAVRELLGMELDRQAGRRAGLEQPVRLLEREGDVLAEGVHRIDQPLGARPRGASPRHDRSM